MTKRIATKAVVPADADEGVAKTPLDRAEELRVLYGRARDAELRAQVDPQDEEAAEELAELEAAIEALDARSLVNELRNERAALVAGYDRAIQILDLPRPRPREIDVQTGQRALNQEREGLALTHRELERYREDPGTFANGAGYRKIRPMSPEQREAQTRRAMTSGDDLGDGAF